MRKLNIIPKIAALLFIGMTIGCEDTDLEDLLSDEDAEVTQSYLKTEGALSNLYSMVDRVLRDSSFQATDSAIVDGATVMRNGNTVTVDFGTGVIGSDGSTRKGQIIVTETGSYMTPNAALGVELFNYFVDDKEVAGELNITKVGNSFELDITDFSAEENVEISADKTVMWTKGFTTLASDTDDVFELSGTATGTELANNRTLTSDITEVLEYDRSCEFRVTQGIIEMNLEAVDSTEEMDAVIDFLDGDGCNNLVKINVSQGDTEVELTKQFKGF